MSTAVPKLSSAKVTFAILFAVTFLFVGCVQISTEGRAFDLRGNDELSGVLYLVAGGWLAFWLYRIAFKSKPSFTLHDDRLEFYSWAQPIYFRDIDEIVFVHGDFWIRRSPTLALRLNNGSIQHLPFGLMTSGPESFADLLKASLRLYQDSQAGESNDLTAIRVTGP